MCRFLYLIIYWQEGCMIKNITDQCAYAVKTARDLFEKDTPAKNVQRAVLTAGFATALGSRAATLHYYPQLGNHLPNIGSIIIVGLTILGALSIRDYGNADEVAAMRGEALLLDIAQVMKSHSSVKKILDSGVLTVEELTDKARVYLQANNSGIKKQNQSIGQVIADKKIPVSDINDSVKLISGSLNRIQQATKWIAEITEWENNPKI
jgi:uncharacterized protein YoxC